MTTTTTSTPTPSEPVYPCDKGFGDGVGRGWHHFQGDYAGNAYCTFCGQLGALLDVDSPATREARSGVVRGGAGIRPPHAQQHPILLWGRLMIGYSVTRLPRCHHTHLMGPVKVEAAFTTMGPACGGPKTTWKVVNGWESLYHDYESPQAAVAQRLPSCPKCAAYGG